MTKITNDTKGYKHYVKYLINNGYTLIIGNAIRFLDMFKLHNCFETLLNESNLRIQLY